MNTGFKLNISNKPTEPVDKKSIEKTIEILKKKGCEVVGDLNTIDRYIPQDISGLTKDGIPFLVEVKDRSFDHLKYGDVLCDYAKIKKFEEQSQYKTMVVFNYYTDGYVAIANPKHGYEVIKRKCPITTAFGDRGFEAQELASMKQEKIFKYD